MNAKEAISLAVDVAEAEGWTWLEPAIAKRKRGWIFFGPFIWHVLSNAESIGCNVRIEIDDTTGRIISKHFMPR
jgi:hypothetical protein